MIKFKISIPLIIILVGILIALVIIFLPYLIKKDNFKILPSQTAGERALTYLNSYVLKNRAKAVLIESKEESGIYKFKLKIENEEFEVFTTKDGKFLFLGFADLTQTFK